MNKFYKFIFPLGFLLLIFSLTNSSAGMIREEQLNQFVTHYYQNPNPDQIPATLRYFVSSNEFKIYMESNQHVIDMLAYFFGRAAELKPKLLREYEKMYDRSNDAGKKFIFKIFSIYRDSAIDKFIKPRMVDSLQKKELQDFLSQPRKSKKFLVKEAQNLNQLDFLWMEFFVSGNRDSILKIIDVLKWKDVFRQRLQDWLLVSHPQREKARLKELLQNDFQVDVDMEHVKINFIGDMDCLYSSFLRSPTSQHENASAGIELKKILNLSDQDSVYIATKGAALVGLWTNVEAHPKVLEICKKQLLSQKKKPNLVLQDIVNSVTPAPKEDKAAKQKKRH